MELRIEQRALSKLLARAAPACAVKSPMAMLTCVLLRAEKNDQVVVQGTDLTLSVSATDQATVKTPGAIAVGARQLNDVVRLLKPGELVLAAKDGRLEVRAGKSRTKVPCVAPDDFPNIPAPVATAPRLKLAAGDLGRLLSQTVYARSMDENRAFLACVRLEHTGGVTKCVALDSKRLALASLPKVDSVPDWADQINARALDALKALCSEFSDEEITCSTHGGLDGYMHFELPGVIVSAKSAGSNFVPYGKLIPAEYKRIAGVGREETLEALKRAALVADKSEGKVRCELARGQLTITATVDSGEAHEELEADYAGETFVWGINAQCFIEALKVLTDDTVLLQTNGPKDPLVIVGEHDANALGLIMFSDLEARS